MPRYLYQLHTYRYGFMASTTPEPIFAEARKNAGQPYCIVRYDYPRTGSSDRTNGRVIVNTELSPLFNNRPV